MHFIFLKKIVEQLVFYNPIEKEMKNNKVLFYYHHSYGEVLTKKQDKLIKPNIPYNNKEYIYKINDGWIVEYYYFNGIKHCYSQGLLYFKPYNEKKHLLEQSYYLDKDNKKQGKTIYYYLNGKTLYDGFSKDGMDDGECFFYHENGMIEIYCFYENGEREGEYKSYYYNGKPRKRHFYKSGKLHEICFDYDQDGISTCCIL